MQPARRLASIAVVAVLGITALSGCRSQPDVAAYIGDRKITEDQVTALLDDAKGKVAEGAQAKPPTRAQVVSTLVLGDVCKRLSEQKDLKPQGEAPVDQVAERLGLPPDSRYAQEISRLYACLTGIPAGEAVTPTKEELADVVARGRAAGVVPPEAKTEEAGAQLDGEELRGGLAQRNALAGAVKDFDVTVNPRYRPLEFPVLSFSDGSAAISVPIGEAGSGTVVDAR